MNIKRQILFSFLFLFGVTVIITGASAYYANRTSNISKVILKDNYNSVVYTKDMLKALSFANDANVIDFGLFEKSLKLQQNNITEKGEKELTDSLTSQFTKLKSDPHSTLLVAAVRDYLYKVMELNMNALETRSREANHSAQLFFNYFLVSIILFVIIAVVLVVKFRPPSENDKYKSDINTEFNNF
jgi:CHASE3 domain sensor protein